MTASCLSPHFGEGVQEKAAPRSTNPTLHRSFRQLVKSRGRSANGSLTSVNRLCATTSTSLLPPNPERPETKPELSSRGRARADGSDPSASGSEQGGSPPTPRPRRRPMGYAAGCDRRRGRGAGGSEEKRGINGRPIKASEPPRGLEPRSLNRAELTELGWVSLQLCANTRRSKSCWTKRPSHGRGTKRGRLGWSEARDWRSSARRRHEGGD